MRDVFLSHATQDKKAFVIPFARSLAASGISFWLDEAEIKWGDKISSTINAGLATSRFVVVFLTPAFVGRNWTEAELSAALARENNEGRTVVLPIVTDAKVILSKYPLLADKKFILWDGSPEPIVAELQALLVDSRKRSLEQLRILATDRMAGRRRVAASIREAIMHSEPDVADDLNLELAIHEFSRLGALKSEKVIADAFAAQITSSFVSRSFDILSALCAVACGDLSKTAVFMTSMRNREQPTDAEGCYLAVQESVAHLALGQIRDADNAWSRLTQRFYDDGSSYPSTKAGRSFGRAFVAVIASNRPVVDIVTSLPIRGHRGVAHFTAVTARVARLSVPVVTVIEAWGAAESWKSAPTKRVIAGRLHSLEKSLLSAAGSLF